MSRDAFVLWLVQQLGLPSVRGGGQAARSVCGVVLELFVAYHVLEIYVVFPLLPLEKKHSSVLTCFMQNEMNKIGFLSTGVDAWCSAA